MGEAGRTRVRNEFSLEKMESSTRQVYLDALALGLK
jgi:hypothetical protein